MATNPVELPVPFPVRAKVFNLMNKQQITPAGSGFIQTITRGTPFWYAEYETPPLADNRYNNMIAFLDSLDGSVGTFLAYDPRRPMPWAYRTSPLTATPWTQPGQTAPRVTAVDYANSIVSMDRLAVGAILTKGDYFSVKVGNIWHLHRIVGNYTTVSTTQANIVVRPRPIFAATSLPAVRYVKACCEMKLSVPYEEDDDVDTFPILRFKGVQFRDRT